MILYHTDGSPLSIGADSSVITSNGFRLYGNQQLRLETEAAIWVISPGGGVVDYIEIYD